MLLVVLIVNIVAQLRERNTIVKEEKEIFLINMEIIKVFSSQTQLPSIKTLYYTFCVLEERSTIF